MTPILILTFGGCCVLIGVGFGVESWRLIAGGVLGLAVVNLAMEIAPFRRSRR